VVVTLLLGVAFAGVDNVALVFLVRDDLDAGAAGYGVVAAAWGVGMLAISLSLIRWSRRIGPRFAYLGGWLSCGIGLVGTGLSPSLGPVATAQLIGGLGNGATNIGGDTMIQRTVSAGTLGRVFGLTATAAFLGGGLAYAAGGLLVDATSPRTAFLIGGAGVLVAFALGVALLPAKTGTVES
jgi:MFS family permease